MARKRSWARGDDGNDPRIAVSFAGGVGFVVMLTAAAVLGEFRSRLSLNVDLGVMSVLVAIAAWWMEPLGALMTAGLAWLMLNSFVVSHDATLRWHGGADLTRLVVLFTCAGVAAVTRSVQLYVRRRAARAVGVVVFPATDLSLTGERHA